MAKAPPELVSKGDDEFLRRGAEKYRQGVRREVWIRFASAVASNFPSALLRLHQQLAPGSLSADQVAREVAYQADALLYELEARDERGFF